METHGGNLKLPLQEKKLVFSSADHNSTLQKLLHKQWTQRQNCDLIITVGSCHLPVHSCVVSCFSTKIRYHLQQAEQAFASVSDSEQSLYNAIEDGMRFCFFKTGEKKVDMNVSQDIVKALVEFMYTGSLSILSQQTMWLYKVAQLLGFSFIVNVVEVFMNRNPHMVGVQTLPAMYLSSNSALPTQTSGPASSEETFSQENDGRQLNFSNQATESQHTQMLDVDNKGEEHLCLETMELDTDIKPELVDADLKAFLDLSSTCQTEKAALTQRNADNELTASEMNLKCGQETDNRETSHVEKPGGDVFALNIKQEVMDDYSEQLMNDVPQRLEESQLNSVNSEVELSAYSPSDIIENNKDGFKQASEETLMDETEGEKEQSAIPDSASFVCAQCKQSYSSQVRLKQHVFTVHKRKKVIQKTCPHCDQHFSNLKDLKIHCTESHGNFVCDKESGDFQTDQSYPCPKCDHQASSKRSLRIHLYDNHAHYSCSRCDQKFVRKAGFTLHQRTVHRYDELHCKQCEHSFYEESDLLKHCKRDHGLIHSDLESLLMQTSSTCNTDTSPEDLRHEGLITVSQSKGSQAICKSQKVKDLENQEEGVPATSQDSEPVIFLGSRWKCRICGKKHCSREERSQHFRDEHLNECFHCLQCQRSFIRKEGLTTHVRTEHEGRYWTCFYCGENFSVSTQFSAHNLTVHGDKKPFRCPEPSCSFKTAGGKYLEIHKIDVHAKERNEVCYKCGSSFPSVRYLALHQRSCLQLEQHLCSICGEVFNLRQSLSNHINNKHGGKRRYSCTHCGRRFSCHANLKRHMRIHNNAFPYVCDICGQKFRHSNSFKDHMQRKHGKGE